MFCSAVFFEKNHGLPMFETAAKVRKYAIMNMQVYLVQKNRIKIKNFYC